jgi:hypothetical protein
LSSAPNTPGSTLLPLGIVLLQFTGKRFSKMWKWVVSMKKAFKRWVPSALAAALNMLGLYLLTAASS